MKLRELLFGADATPHWQKSIISVLAGSILIFVFKILAPWSPIAIRTDLNSETEERKKLAEQVNSVSTDLGQLKSDVEQIRSIVELQAIVMTADPASESRRKAIVDLRSAVRPRIETFHQRDRPRQ